MMENKIINKNFANIRLESLRGFFAYGGETLKFLNDNGVITVEDFLLEKYKDIPENKYSSFSEKAKAFFKRDIGIAKKMLECKYLGIDPNMNIEMYDSISEVADALGFSDRTTHILKRHITYQEFMDILKLPKNDAFKKLALIGAGVHTSNEIYFKTEMILKYYNNAKKENVNVSDDKSMYFELVELSKQVKELDKKIDSMLDRMLENMEEEKFSEEIKTYIKRK